MELFSTVIPKMLVSVIILQYILRIFKDNYKIFTKNYYILNIPSKIRPIVSKSVSFSTSSAANIGSLPS